PSSATPVGGIVSAPPSSIGALPPPGGALSVTPTAPPISLPPPISPAPIEPAPSTPSTEHTVMRGETGAVIAKKYGMGWKAIEAANPGVDSRKLKIGQKLMIPAKSIAPNPMSTGDAGTGAAATETYTVKSGDTLGRIAKSQGVTIKAIKSANNLKLDAIKVGQKLKIPSQPAPAAVAPPAPAPLPVTDYTSPTALQPSSVPPYSPPAAPGLAPISASSLPPPPRP
ncbi:MAG: LysM peptidoglycan-binding domain-containing protein, partial [Verrucomicrobia bacterium]|nr:LysM peptidoglycan-binding domain-containing protein [Verrucomicrobiota bacterium]